MRGSIVVVMRHRKVRDVHRPRMPIRLKTGTHRRRKRRVGEAADRDAKDVRCDGDLSVDGRAGLRAEVIRGPPVAGVKVTGSPLSLGNVHVFDWPSIVMCSIGSRACTLSTLPVRFWHSLRVGRRFLRQLDHEPHLDLAGLEADGLSAGPSTATFNSARRARTASAVRSCSQPRRYAHPGRIREWRDQPRARLTPAQPLGSSPEAGVHTCLRKAIS
jgi:hypothetical protein